MGFNLKREKDKPKLVVQLKSIMDKLTANSKIFSINKKDFIGISLTETGNLEFVLSIDGKIKDGVTLTPENARELIKEIQQRMGKMEFM